MVYVDTSAMVKLYIREVYSQEVSDWVRANNEAIPKTIFHELEFTNAVNLKQFRNEMEKGEAETVLERFSKHERDGVFYRPQTNWPDTFARALELSKSHTTAIGSRSLDIIHVALALGMEAGRFLTFDQKQARLATVAGLEAVDCLAFTQKT